MEGKNVFTGPSNLLSDFCVVGTGNTEQDRAFALASMQFSGKRGGGWGWFTLALWSPLFASSQMISDITLVAWN